MGWFHWLLACHHRQLSRILTIRDETFQVCLCCGERLPYSWETMSRLRASRQRNGNAVPSYAEVKTQWDQRAGAGGAA